MEDRMKKKNIIIVSVLAILLFVGGGIGLYLISKKVEEKPSDSALKFQSEYEEYNGKQNATGKDYPVVEVPEKNPIVYQTDEEVLDVFKGTGVIYFGYNTCPWCRNIVPVLLSAADSNGLDRIYYVDIKSIRDTKIVKDKKVITSKEGSEGYYKILEAMDSVLDEYTVKDDKGKEYKTGEKRLYAPTVVFVKDGAIVDIHVDTVESHVAGGDGYVPLNKEQQDELFNIYTKGIQKVLGTACDDAC